MDVYFVGTLVWFVVNGEVDGKRVGDDEDEVLVGLHPEVIITGLILTNALLFGDLRTTPLSQHT